tara:strand:+ start:10118 stop:10609 length:492 start_codon:yes stop_codon:yes gene_type:complete
MNILIIGNCGVGKTWVMKELIYQHNLRKRGKLGMFKFHHNDNILVLGKYDNSTFEGGDKLSMAVMRDTPVFKDWVKSEGVITIAEGDRFMNSTYIENMNPIIIRIKGTGVEGRRVRNSEQTERHLKAINTRVSNVADRFGVISVYDSNHCLRIINKQIDELGR